MIGKIEDVRQGNENDRQGNATDQPEMIPKGLFDEVKFHTGFKNSYRDKIAPLINLPYKKTMIAPKVSPIIEITSPS